MRRLFPAAALLAALLSLAPAQEAPLHDLVFERRVRSPLPPFSEAPIQVPPRINDRGQRRLLCSIRYRDVLTHLAGVDPRPPAQPTLFGVEHPRTATSKSRDSKQD